MSELKIRYREQPGNGMYPSETSAKYRTEVRAKNLLFETCIAAIWMISVAGNIISYTHIKDLRQQQDKQVLQYDSLLSAKLLSDKELMLIKAQLNKNPAEKALIRILPQQRAALPEGNGSADRK